MASRTLWAVDGMHGGIFDVQDRVVVVTGGLGKLGSTFCAAFVRHGARVVAVDCIDDAKRRRALFSRCRDPNNLLFVHADITNRASLEQSLRTIRDRWGSPFALINNAALDSPPCSPADENGPFENYPEASWDRIMEVNVKGVFLCCQVFGKAMADQGKGSIVNIASVYGMVSPDQRIYEYRNADGQAFFKPAAYSASKSSLYNLTRYLATYWAAKGVRVNTLTFAGIADNQDEEFLRAYCARVPLGRMADREEYCGAVIFLVSDASSYMTGSNMTLDGGLTAW